MKALLFCRVVSQWHATAVVATFLLLASGTRCVLAEQLLRWKLIPGEALRYEFVQATQTETTGAGKPMRVAIDSTMTVAWKVEAVDDRQVADISQTIDQFRIVLKTDKLDPITYDSTSTAPLAGPAREIAAGVQPLIGASCRLRMTDRGEILSVEPSDQLRQATGPADDSAAGNMLTPDGMARMLSQAAVPLPESPVTVGNTWESTSESVAAIGRIRQQSRFTYEGPLDRAGSPRDKLAVAATFTLVPAPDAPAGGTKLLAGRQSGSLWFDSDAGHFIGSELEQQLDTERPYRDLKITIRSTSKLAMKLLSHSRP